MRETGPEHPLYQAHAKLIARRFDCDDALFHLMMDAWHWST